MVEIMPRGGTPVERVLMIVATTMALLAVAFAVFVMVTPEWDPAKTLAIGTILGSLLSLSTAIIGVLGAMYLNKRSKENGSPNGGNNDS